MDPEIQALSGETAPSESPPIELENLDNQIEAGKEPAVEEPGSAADVTGEPGEDGEDADPQRKPVPYDRFKTVNEGRKARDKALEAAGMRFNEETQAVEQIAPVDDELDWEAPQTDTEDRPSISEESVWDRKEIYTEAFWEMTPQEMVANPIWKDIADTWGFNLDEAVHNELTIFKGQANNFVTQRYISQQQSMAQKAQADAAEISARGELSTELKAIKADAEFSVSPKAVAFVDAEVKRFKDAGYSASQIQTALYGIKKTAYYENRADYVKAEAQRMVKGESARTVRMGAQSPGSEPETGTATIVNLTQDERELCDMAGITYQKYAERKEKANGSV